MSTRRAFTLIEMIMALAACAVILTAVYGVFTRAIHLRNDATERVSASRSRAHAAAVLRNDLRNARISWRETRGGTDRLARHSHVELSRIPEVHRDDGSRDGRPHRLGSAAD